MRRIHYFMCALLALTWTTPLVAQQPTGTIRGRITDNSTQQPIAGVSIVVGNRNTVTRDDGRFTITGVPVGSDLLRARVIGYAQVNQPVMIAGADTVVVDLQLTAQAIGLADVIVTGYGEQRKADITGSITQVTDSQFNTGRVISPQLLIQSKVPGVQVVDNNDPGGGLSIRIRGATSVTARADPLYVIDGVPVGTGAGGGLSAGRDPLNFINPADVQDITVLRDASAAAIYGTNAANGVVLITTKSGKGHAGSSVEYTSSASSSSVTRLPNMLNAAQFAAAVATYAPSRVDSLLGQNTDWLRLVDRTAFGQEHNVAFTNNGSDMNYRLSVGYLNQEGIIQASSTKRVTLGLSYSQRLFNDRLNLRTSVRGSRAVDQFTPGDVLGNAAAMAPTQPVMDPSSPTGFWEWRTTNASPSNPLAIAALAKDHGTTWRSVGNAVAEYQLPFLQGLTANVNVGYDLTRADHTTFYPNNLAAQIKQGQGLFFLANNSETNSLLEMYMGYAPQRTYGPGRLNLVGGYSYSQMHGEYPFLRETNLSTNLLGDNGIPQAVNVTNVRNITDYKLISFFGRANYNINDRYLAAASVRRDASSRFGPGRQWGTFPSLSAAWRLSQEPFFQVGGISDLKLRFSWARTGNQAIDDFLFFPTYTFSDAQSQVWFDGGFVTTIRPSAVDEFIHWETTNAYNAGLDFGFSNQRYSGTIDWYTKNTSDLIFNTKVASGTTVGTFVTTNIGSMRNRGFEVSLNANVLEARSGGLRWTASVTASHNANKLLSIDPRRGVASILTGNISGGVGNLVQILRPGYPIYSFFVYQQRYDAGGKPIYDAATPTNMYVDQNNDGFINDADRRPFHDPSPKWIVGHSSYFNYKHFDAGITLRAYLGNWVYNNVASSNGAYQNLTGSAMPSNLHSSVLTTGFVVPQYYSDYFVEDASFLRMDNITLGYALTYKDRPIRLYGTIQNAFTITGYSGVDPTAGLNGLDNNIYPRSRTITTGLSVRF